MSEAITPIYISLDLFPPSANGIWRGGKGGRHYLSPKYKLWREQAADAALKQSTKMIVGSFAVQINAKRPDKRRRDIDNIIKPLVDLLVSCGFVTDDCEMQFIQAQWVERGPPIWMAVRPCTRWATDIPQAEVGGN